MLSLSVGGSGGTGGTSGNVSVTNNGVVQTAGPHSTGIDTQSVGGGGGAGGAAESIDTGVQITVAAAVGGSGGDGGTGGVIQSANNGQVVTIGADAHGLQAQSVGGGGGHGAASVAEAFQVANDSDFPSVNLNVALGGKGGKGGGAANVSADNEGAIFTTGRGAIGVFAQSVGGGGGDGGNSNSSSQSFQASTINVTTTIGGAGGSGGTSGQVDVTNNGLITTLHKGATGVFAQSVAGGGGNGGFGKSDTGSFQGNDPSLQLTVTIGGDGGTGNNGGGVQVDNTQGGIITRGDDAAGVFAQSVGGGGSGAGSVADGSGGTFNVDVAVGGKGGSGGTGGGVTVNSGGAILTSGGDAAAIHAQSVGGGGGKGGHAATGSGTDPEVAASDFIAQGIGIGANVINLGNNVYALKDQITGDFGVLGTLESIVTSYDDNNPDGPPVTEGNSSSSNFSLNIGGGFGGGGGAGGAGGAVTVTNTGDIETDGPASEAIFAQSVGGGGGRGGITNPSTLNTVLSPPTVSGTIGVGGNGGAAGNGGNITVSNSGSITTEDDLSFGIHAQSIGGGGGKGGATTAQPGAISTFSIAIGGNGGASGSGGTVMVTNTGRLVTQGDDAIGIVAQSIGGGGGMASLMSMAPDSNSGGKAQSQTGLIPDTTLIPVTIGGSEGASGNGGAVTVNAASVFTSGIDAYGVLAQSIGGGGGLVVGTNNPPDALAKLFPAKGKLSGDGGPVVVNVNGNVVTTGAGAVGVLAQSLGGGGGLIGGMSEVDLASGAAANPPPQNGDGGDVKVNLAPNAFIVTSGANAHGVFAQSVGGGGGILGQPDGSGSTFAPPASGCSGSSCSTVSVDVGQAEVLASGQNAYAVYVQGLGTGVGIATVTVDAGGSIQSLEQSAAAIFVDGEVGILNAGLIDDGVASGQPNATGVAIGGTGFGIIENRGTINGSIELPHISSTINNESRGTLNTGQTVDLGADGVLTNAGTINARGRGRIATTSVRAQLVQTAAGTLEVDSDHAHGRADRLGVSGAASLGGTIAMRPRTLTRTPVTVLEADALTIDPDLAATGSTCSTSSRVLPATAWS